MPGLGEGLMPSRSEFFHKFLRRLLISSQNARTVFRENSLLKMCHGQDALRSTMDHSFLSTRPRARQRVPPPGLRGKAHRAAPGEGLWWVAGEGAHPTFYI